MPDPSLTARLAALRTRGEVKRLGADLDTDPTLRAAAVSLAEERGIEVDRDTSGKRLVRMLLDRAEDAQERKNPIHRDEAFTCLHCGRDVPIGGARVRDHCPWCLRSRHVDRVPGDRANVCQGRLDPVGFDRVGDEVTIRYQCATCGATGRMRAHPDDRIPPSLDAGDVGSQGGRGP